MNMKIYLVCDGEVPVAVAESLESAKKFASDYESSVSASDRVSTTMNYYPTAVGSWVGEVYNNLIFKQLVK